MKNSSQLKGADQAEEIHLLERLKLKTFQWIKIEDQQLLVILEEGLLLFNKTERAHMRLISIIIKMPIMRVKAIMEKERVRKLWLKLWGKMWLSLKVSKMSKTNYKMEIMKLYSSIYK